MFEPEMLSDSHYDLIITAVDNGQLRYDLGNFASGQPSDLLWLDTGVDKNQGQVLLGHLGVPDCELRIPNVYDLYADMLLTKKESEPLETTGGCSTLAASLAAQGLFVNRCAADIAGDMMFHLIRQGHIDYHGNYFSISPMEMKPFHIDADIWSSFGYRG